MPSTSTPIDRYPLLYLCLSAIDFVGIARNLWLRTVDDLPSPIIFPDLPSRFRGHGSNPGGKTVANLKPALELSVCKAHYRSLAHFDGLGRPYTR